VALVFLSSPLLAPLLGVFLVLPFRSVGSAPARLFGWSAALGAVVTCAAALIWIASARHVLAGGDQCPVVSTGASSVLVWLELLCSLFAAVAVGSIFGAGRRFAPIGWRLLLAVGALASVAVAWFALILVGACGS
jgi:hypothetical protein